MVVIAEPITQNDGTAIPLPGRGGQWYVTSGPESRCVTADQLRSHCNLDDESYGTGADFNPAPYDTELCLYIDAAIEYAEDRLEASLSPRTIVATFYDGQVIDLPRGPVIAITNITDRTGDAVTRYAIRGIGNTTRIVPTGGIMYPVTVTYRAGYATPSGTAPAIPADLRLMILQLAATYWTNRESVAEKSMVPIPHAVEAFFSRKSRGTGVG